MSIIACKHEHLLFRYNQALTSQNHTLYRLLIAQSTRLSVTRNVYFIWTLENLRNIIVSHTIKLRIKTTHRNAFVDECVRARCLDRMSCWSSTDNGRHSTESELHRIGILYTRLWVGIWTWWICSLMVRKRDHYITNERWLAMIIHMCGCVWCCAEHSPA